METQPLDNLRSLAYFGPELGLCGAIVLIILWDLIAKEPRAKVSGYLAIALSALAYSAGMSAFLLVKNAKAQNLFYGLLAFDHFSNFFRILFAFVTGAILISRSPRKRTRTTTPLATWASSSRCC